MKIENMVTKAQLDKIVLHLTRNEAAELRDALKSLLEESETSRHEHIPSGDFLKEITVLISD